MVILSPPWKDRGDHAPNWMPTVFLRITHVILMVILSPPWKDRDAHAPNWMPTVFLMCKPGVIKLSYLVQTTGLSRLCRGVNTSKVFSDYWILDECLQVCQFASCCCVSRRKRWRVPAVACGSSNQLRPSTSECSNSKQSERNWSLNTGYIIIGSILVILRSSASRELKHCFSRIFGNPSLRTQFGMRAWGHSCDRDCTLAIVWI